MPRSHRSDAVGPSPQPPAAAAPPCPAPGGPSAVDVWRRGVRVLERSTLVVAVLALVVHTITIPGQEGTVVGAVAALVLGTTGLALVRRAPTAALVLVAVAPVVGGLLGSNPVAVWSVGCFVALLVTLRGTSGLLAGGVVGVGNLVGTGLALGTVLPTEDTTASLAAFFAVALAAVGSAVHAQLQYRVATEQRLAQAEATRQAAVDRSVAEERLRIARDLHDSVGHQIAVVGMHLGAAEVHLPADPGTADGTAAAGTAAVRADLAAARTGVQEVLRETQQILRVLRVGAEPGPAGPPPGHTAIADLVARCRAAGQDVAATLPAGLIDAPAAPAGPAPPWPQDVSAAAYRIVQEALTNAHRHGTGQASLTVTGPDAAGLVVVEVVNRRRSTGTGRAAPRTGGGHGLVGMRERATAAGGRLDTHDDGRVFWLRAELPTGTTRTEARG